METDLKKTIGQSLQRIRTEKNLTQEQMGEQLSLSTSAYCKIEYGETDLTLTRLIKIAEILRTTPCKLFQRISLEIDHPNLDSNSTKDFQYYESLSSHNPEDLCEILKTQNKLINMLEKRIEMLEKKL